MCCCTLQGTMNRWLSAARMILFSTFLCLSVLLFWYYFPFFWCHICFDFNSSQAQLRVANVGSRNYTLPRQSLLGFSSHILLLDTDPYLGLARICANASFPRHPVVLCSDIVPSTLPDTALYPSKWEEGCYCCRMRYIKRMCSARQDDSTLVRKRNFSVFLKAGSCIQHQCEGALANTCKRVSQKKCWFWGLYHRFTGLERSVFFIFLSKTKPAGSSVPKLCLW